jgi:5-methylcytosine-specific restriction endonuclease McrA
MRTWYRVRYDESKGTEVKKCSQCHIEKSVSEFYMNGKRGYHGKCKECDKLGNKERYDANPEKYCAASRESYHKYPDRARARYQRWYEINRERMIRHYREYNETHREERRAYDRKRHRKETPEFRRMWYEQRREYYQEYVKVNRDRMRANERTWRQTFPEKHAEKEQRRRAHKMNAPRIEKIDRQAIIDRDKWICYLCGIICTPKNVTLDHVVPLARDGSHTADNLRVACRPCNSRKGVRPLHGFLA